MEWWSSSDTFFAILALFASALAYGKIQYEKNPEFFESGQKFRKDWRTWKPNKTPSIHSRVINSVHRC